MDKKYIITDAHLKSIEFLCSTISNMKPPCLSHNLSGDRHDAMRVAGERLKWNHELMTLKEMTVMFMHDFKKEIVELSRSESTYDSNLNTHSVEPRVSK